MATSASTLLRRLEAIRDDFGGGEAARKLEHLRALERRRLRTAAEVLRLHEALCFLRAYPDDATVLEQVVRMLEAFEKRGDLRRHRRALADTGIAGTDIYYRFFWSTAEWLARRIPRQLSVDWRDFDNRDQIDRILHLLLPYSESLLLDDHALTPREWIERLKKPGETDAEFLVRRFATIHPGPFGRETLFERLDTPFRLAAGPGTPSRTLAASPVSRISYQSTPLDRGRPDLRRAAREKPAAVRWVSPREGARLIALARDAMITRARDLDNFMHADRNDVRIFEYGNGLQFACFGLLPERRLMLESVYGMLTIKNGVPMGYVLASGIMRSCEVMYNVFETYRGGESARIYGHVLSMLRHLFGADTFSVDPYQLGHDNSEGQKSGAWWFYYKLGFRPVDPDVRRVLRSELARMRKDRRHRSSPATLQELSAAYVFLHLGRERNDVLGLLSLGNIGDHLSRHVSEGWGADREAAMRECSQEAARLLGVRSMRSWSAGERLWWERWSPLVLVLPGIARWARDEKRALVDVIRAKGGRSEADYVRLFDRHRKLWRAVVRLAAG